MSKIISNIQNNFMDCDIERNNNRITITKEKHKVRLSYVLKDCKIKYLPKKFDKLVVEIDKECYDLLKPLYDFMDQNVSNLTNLEKNKLGLKIDELLKNKLSTNKVGQTIDIAFEFNDIWVLNKTAYPSFKLLQYKLVEKEEIDLLESVN